MTMPRLTLGDMAQANLMQISQARMKSDILRLSTEMTTGTRTGLNPKLGGDITPLSALERPAPRSPRGRVPRPRPPPPSTRPNRHSRHSRPSLRTLRCLPST